MPLHFDTHRGDNCSNQLQPDSPPDLGFYDMTGSHHQAVDISETVGVEAFPEGAPDGFAVEGAVSESTTRCIPGKEEELANDGMENGFIDRWSIVVRRKRRDAMGKRAILAKLQELSEEMLSCKAACSEGHAVETNTFKESSNDGFRESNEAMIDRVLKQQEPRFNSPMDAICDKWLESIG